MTKEETKEVVKKIKVYYPYFKLEKEGLDEWHRRLKPYDYQDVLDKVEEHLKGDKAEEPPKLHFITKFLKTPEEKKRYTGDFIINCNLCGKEMTLSEYDNEHYGKCLLIKSLLPILKAKGEDVSYEILDEYDYETLDKVWDKYQPTKQNINELIGGITNGTSN